MERRCPHVTVFPSEIFLPPAHEKREVIKTLKLSNHEDDDVFFEIQTDHQTLTTEPRFGIVPRNGSRLINIRSASEKQEERTMKLKIALNHSTNNPVTVDVHRIVDIPRVRILTCHPAAFSNILEDTTSVLHFKETGIGNQWKREIHVLNPSAFNVRYKWEFEKQNEEGHSVFEIDEKDGELSPGDRKTHICTFLPKEPRSYSQK